MKTIFDLELIHYSGEGVTRVDSLAQEQRNQGCFKPCGFWVSVEGNGDGWKEWCEAEEFRLENLACVHAVTLAPTAHLIFLTDVEGMDAFTQRYAQEPRNEYVDWKRVAQDYQGILIAPYLHERRFDPMWYYCWDCASGCIWDAIAVSSVVLKDPA